jgi:hypothetical protein
MYSLVQKHTVAPFLNTFHIKLENRLEELWSTIIIIILILLLIIIIIIIIDATGTFSKYTSNNRGTGTMSKSFRKYLSNIPGKHEIKKLQETVILGTAHVRGKVLKHTCEIFNMGNNITCAKRVTEEQLQHYTLKG